MLTEDQTKRLARIARHRTRYEIVATRGEQTVLVCYEDRRSIRGLIACIRWRGAQLVALTGAEEFKVKDKAAQIGEWTVRFSGRTQRECIISGEHPFICDLA